MAGGPRSGYKAKHSLARASAVAVAVAMLAAFGIRAGLGIAWRDRVYRFGDSQTYRRLAENVVAGRGLVIDRRGGDVGPDVRRADRMPAYPLVLAGLTALFGENAVSLVLLQALVGAVAVWLAFLLGREVYSPLAGVIAAVAMALAPWQVYFATLALTECWSAALLLMTVLCAVRAVRRNKLSWSVGAGAACAALVTVHPEFLGLPALLLLAAVVVPGRRRWLAHWALAAAVVVVALLPWWVRNARVFGALVPATTRLGVTLYDSVRPGATGGTDMQFERERAREMQGLDELAYDAAYRRKSWDVMRSEPGRMVPLAMKKLGRLWSPVPNAWFAQAPFYRWASILGFVPMVGGALLGAVVLLRRVSALALLLVPVAWVTMVHSVLVGSVRYRVPIEPMLLVLSALAVAWVVEGERKADD